MFVSRVGVVGDERLEVVVRKAGYEVATDDLGAVDLVLADGDEELFAELDQRTPGYAILAATGPRALITALGDVTSRPDLVVGMHFTNTRLVEVVEGEDTARSTAQIAANFAQSLRRQPVLCGESPGLILNRILLAAADAEGAEELFDADALAAARADAERIW